MPNHFHAILEIINQNENNVGATLVVDPNNDIVDPNNDIVDPNNDIVDPNNDMVGQNRKGEPTDYQKGQPQGIAPTGNPTKNQTNKKTLGDILGAFQSITTVEYIRGVKTRNWKPFDKKIWQRNYWEHIIRNEKSYNTISKYVKNNPLNWDNDKFCK